MANSNRRQSGREKKYWSVGLSRIPSSLFKLIWWVCSCICFLFRTLFLTSSLSMFEVSFPLLSYILFPSSFFFFSISKGFSPRGKEGVIWSLPALIKTSVWLTGISCADVWVCVYFSVVLWPHDNLSPLFLFLSCFFFLFSLPPFVFLRASMKHPAKKSECFFWVGSSFCLSVWFISRHCSSLTLG